MDKKHKKKLKRSAKKKKDQATAHETKASLTKQMGMFDKIPSNCSTCATPFPKTQEAHSTWRVVVKYEKQKVWLFCPECQVKVQNVVEKRNEV